jgi:hypothetical protein
MDSFIKHSALIWQQDGCTVDQARFAQAQPSKLLKAWCEGPEGYKKRLEAQKEYLSQVDEERTK